MKKHIKTVFDILRKAGAAKVNIYFDGSGDSGMIEEITVYNADNQKIKVDQTVIYPKEKSTWIVNQFIYETEQKEIPILEALETYCYEELEKTNIDWYNNDGGCGEMRINLNDPEVMLGDNTVSIELEVKTRYTEYKTTTFNFRLNEDEEIKKI